MSGNAALSQTQFTYGRMFDDLPPFCPTDEELVTLGVGMHALVPAKHSKMPAGYVFLGQFIDHDLARDPDGHSFPGGIKNPYALVNRREPFFNLDILYGKGPRVDTHLYKNANSILLRLGTTTTGLASKHPFENDLPRKKQFSVPPPKEAEIFDPLTVDSRQDENLGIAQTHVAFIKFHNAVVNSDEFKDNHSLENFEAVKKVVIMHYQWIVLRDFLPRVIDEDILKEVEELVRTGGETHYRPDKDKPFMPVEFSVAAFRMGHSMVSKFYDWNRIFREASISDLGDFTGRGRMSNLPNVFTLPSRWVIDWTRFYDFTGVAQAAKPVNFASAIDTSIIRRFLTFLPNDDAANKFKASLAVRNLFRGRMMRLPTGQAVAAKLGLPVIPAAKITEKMDDSIKGVFGDDTPLWYYILKEAEDEAGGERLGRLGSRIMAEAMLGLMKLSPYSILKEPRSWRPSLCPDERKDNYAMADLLNYVAVQNRTPFNELNPLG